MSYQIRFINRGNKKVSLTYDSAKNPDHALEMFAKSEEGFHKHRPDIKESRIVKILSVRRVHEAR